MSRLLHLAAAVALAAVAAASLIGLATAAPSGADRESAHRLDCPKALCVVTVIF